MKSHFSVPIVCVCGGRYFEGRTLLFCTLDRICRERGWMAKPDSYGNSLPRVHVITGDATGADQLAIAWAQVNWCSYKEYEADWKGIGPAAGPRRNQDMLDKGAPDLVVAFPGGGGTADMVRRARALGVEVIEVKHAQHGGPDDEA